MFWEKFVDLCVNNSTTPNAVAKKLSIASGAVTKWKNGAVPHQTTLLKIANYFDVSVNYLLGQKETHKFWDVFYSLCSCVGKSPNAVAKEIGASSGSITTWKNGRVPHHDTLLKISTYFDVSVDYLLGKSEKADFWEKFVRLCNKNNTTPTAVVSELGISRGSVTGWKNGSVPNDGTLLKLADYFGVSVEELISEQKETLPEEIPAGRDELDIEILNLYSQLSDEQKPLALTYLKFLKSQSSSKTQ